VREVRHSFADLIGLVNDMAARRKMVDKLLGRRG
jgi:hypothetical protein